MFNIEISHPKGCSGGCRHCDMANKGGLIEGTKSVPHQTQSNIISLLRLRDFKEENVSLDFSSPVHTFNLEGFDLGEEVNPRITVTGTTLDLDEGSQKKSLDVYFNDLLGRYPNAESVFLSPSRHLLTAELQMRLLPSLVRRGVDEVFQKKSIKHAWIVGGINDIIPNQFEHFMAKYQAIYDGILGKGEKSQYHLIGKSIAQLGKEYTLQPFVKNPEPKPGQIMYSGGFSTGEKSTLLFATLSGNQDKGIVGEPKDIASYVRSLPVPLNRVHFSGDRINVFHNTNSTRVSGVWATQEQFDMILEGAKEHGYNEALARHFDRADSN